MALQCLCVSYCYCGNHCFLAQEPIKSQMRLPCLHQERNHYLEVGSKRGEKRVGGIRLERFTPIAVGWAGCISTVHNSGHKQEFSIREKRLTCT